MPNAKANDLALLAAFLERENERCELLQNARAAVLRIGSLIDAENQAGLALEGAQADLAWARAEVDAAQAGAAAAKEAARNQIEAVRLETEAEIALSRQRYAEEDAQLDAQIAEKRAELEKIAVRIESVRAAAGVIAQALAKA